MEKEQGAKEAEEKETTEGKAGEAGEKPGLPPEEKKEKRERDWGKAKDEAFFWSLLAMCLVFPFIMGFYGVWMIPLFLGGGIAFMAVYTRYCGIPVICEVMRNLRNPAFFLGLGIMAFGMIMKAFY